MNSIHSDGLPTKDLLGRKKFADDLGRSLVKSFESGFESLVIGINGDWGSGKSTLLKFLDKAIKNEIPERKERLIFHFNPWMFSGTKELQSTFLDQLSKELKPENKILKQSLNIFSAALKSTDSIPLSVVSEGLVPGAEAIKGVANKFLKELASSSIEKLKSKIDKELLKQNFRLFIFIDDLDRLSPKEVTEVFQLIKLNANFKNTIFVIAYDKEVVINSIATQLGINGDKYLDKIIQVDYRIPDPLDYQIKKILFDNLISFLSLHKIPFDEMEFEVIWLVRGLKFYFRNIRDIYRYINALKVRLVSIYRDINVIHFLVIEAIRIFDYEGYIIIQKNFKKINHFGSDSISSKAIDTINENSRKLYDFLFGEARIKTFERPKDYPIYDIQFFDRYFALSIDSQEIPEEQFQVLLRDERSRKSILRVAIKNGEITFVLNRLCTSIVSEIEVNHKSLLHDLIEVWVGQKESFKENRWFLLDALLNICEAFKDTKVGYRLFFDELKMEYTEFSPANFFYQYIFLIGPVGGSKSVNNFHSYIENFKPELEVAFKHQLQNHSNSFFFTDRKYLFDSHFFYYYFILGFAKYNNESYNLSLNQYLGNDQNAIQFLTMFLSRNELNYNDLRLDLTNKDLLLPSLFDSFIEKLNSIKKEKLNANDKRDIDFFLIALKTEKIIE